jgi:hypothetical protein
MKFRLLVSFLLFAFLIQAQTSSQPTVADAEKFMNEAEARLSDLTVKLNRAGWVQENFITDDTEALSADAEDQITAVTTEMVDQAKRFEAADAGATGTEIPAPEIEPYRAGAARCRATQGDDHNCHLA